MTKWSIFYDNGERGAGFLSQSGNTAGMEWFRCRGRAFLYAFLSAVFSDHLTGDRMRQLVLSDDLDALLGGLDNLHMEEAVIIRKNLEPLVTDWTIVEVDNLELELQKEFTRLFLLPAGVHPYESVYLGSRKLLMGKPWEKVREFYRSLGLEKNGSQMHPEDHIAVELGFMASLAYMSAEARGKKQREVLEIEREFLLEHPARWFPELARDIRARCNQEQFYYKAAQVLENLLILDQKLLDTMEK
jgi:TorA maturation chaperone TorD